MANELLWDILSPCKDSENIYPFVPLVNSQLWDNRDLGVGVCGEGKKGLYYTNLHTSSEKLNNNNHIINTC